MKHTYFRILFLFYSLFFLTGTRAQRAELSFLGGFSNYVGDLQQNVVSLPDAGLAMGLIYKHPLSEKFWLRTGISGSKLSAWDGHNEEDLRLRNLSFQSQVTDGYVALEYRLFSEGAATIIPYIFAGAGMFHFNPYVNYGDKGQKVYLQPLGTEGQGLPEYPERKMYKLNQAIIPLGGGLLWHANEKWTLGVEFRNNFAFTDYLDDVSSNYALEAPLLRDRGQLAVDLAWRRDEIDNSQYPANERRRGNPNNNDWYYYLGINIGYKLPGTGRVGGSGYKNGKTQLGCPKW